MILDKGDKILAVHRRLFREDQPRYFTGVVDRCEDGLALVTGHSWVREPVSGEILRKPDRRQKLISLNSGTLILYRLDRRVRMENLEMRHGPTNEVVLSDGAELAVDLTERAHAA